MRVVILTNGQGNQKALACRIAERSEVAAIIVSRNIPRSRPNAAKRFRLLINSAAGRTVGRPFVDAWYEMIAAYEAEFPWFPVKNVIEVSNVNDDETVQAIKKYSPDLIAVSGTNLVGRKVIEAARSARGIVNLHTGISPYVRGGPNCTNWCLAKEWFHLIGNTVMWLDIGIDTGNIIATEQTPLDGSETLTALHKKVMDHAHLMYKNTIAAIGLNSPVPSIPQATVANGSHFNSVDWTAREMRRALYNFRHSYRNYFTGAVIDRSHFGNLKLYPLADA